MPHTSPLWRNPSKHWLNTRRQRQHFLCPFLKEGCRVLLEAFLSSPNNTLRGGRRRKLWEWEEPMRYSEREWRRDVENRLLPEDRAPCLINKVDFSGRWKSKKRVAAGFGRFLKWLTMLSRSDWDSLARSVEKGLDGNTKFWRAWDVQRESQTWPTIFTIHNEKHLM